MRNVPVIVGNGPALPLARQAVEKLYRIVNKADSAADVFIYDVIGDSWDGTTAQQFAIDIKALGDVQQLNIFINSPGGSVFDGVAIYNILDRHKANKTVTIDGLAASIASIVAMVGDEVIMAENAMMMIHNPYAIAFGEAGDLRKQADMLDQIRAVLINTYVRRTGQDEAKIGAMMDAETWMTAAEAVELGFADKTAAPVAMAALARHPVANLGFKHVPKDIAEIKVDPAEPANAPADNADADQPAEPADFKPSLNPAIARAEAVLMRSKFARS